NDTLIIIPSSSKIDALILTVSVGKGFSGIMVTFRIDGLILGIALP
ncbi:unnamed protein product, partial [marine sediment metagenome]